MLRHAGYSHMSHNDIVITTPGTAMLIKLHLSLTTNSVSNAECGYAAEYGPTNERTCFEHEIPIM